MEGKEKRERDACFWRPVRRIKGAGSEMPPR